MKIRNEIIAKTAQLFRLYGIKGNTMDDIARELGISKKTLYQNVSDKNELIGLVIKHDYQLLHQEVQNIQKLDTDCVNQIIKLNVLIIEFLKGLNPASINDLNKQYQGLYNESSKRYETLFFGALVENIKRGKESGVFRKDSNENVIAKHHAERIKQLIESKDLWDIKNFSTESLRDLIIYYIRGLITSDGEQLLNKYIKRFNEYLNK